MTGHITDDRNLTERVGEVRSRSCQRWRGSENNIVEGPGGGDGEGNEIIRDAAPSRSYKQIEQPGSLDPGGGVRPSLG